MKDLLDALDYMSRNAKDLLDETVFQWVAEELRARNWIAMKDQVPKEGQRVIYYFKGVGAHVGKYFGDSEGGHVFGGPSGWLTDDVTHWMPLPEYPDVD